MLPLHADGHPPERMMRAVRSGPTVDGHRGVHAARTGVTLGGTAVTPLVPRVVLQAFFIAVLWWAGVRSKPTDDRVDSHGANRSE